MEKTSKNTSSIYTLLQENTKSRGRTLGGQLGYKVVSYVLLSDKQINPIVRCCLSDIRSDCAGTAKGQRQVAQSQVYHVPILGFELTVDQGVCHRNTTL